MISVQYRDVKCDARNWQEREIMSLQSRVPFYGIIIQLTSCMAFKRSRSNLAAISCSSVVSPIIRLDLHPSSD